MNSLERIQNLLGTVDNHLLDILDENITIGRLSNIQIARISSTVEVKQINDLLVVKL